MSSEKMVKCPECGCDRVYKDGVRYTRHGEVQRYNLNRIMAWVCW